MDAERSDEVGRTEVYVPPEVEPIGSLPEVTFGVAPAVPTDQTLINARPIGVIS